MENKSWLLDNLKEKRKDNGTFSNFNLMRKDHDYLYKAIQPPATYKKHYELLSEIHRVLNEMCNAAINPDGDADSYAKRIRELNSKYVDLANQVNMELESVK